MANPLTDDECEAIALLQAGNPQAFNIMMHYFVRMYDNEARNAVDCNINVVDVHRGRARAFRQIACIHQDATKRLND